MHETCTITSYSGYAITSDNNLWWMQYIMHDYDYDMLNFTVYVCTATLETR